VGSLNFLRLSLKRAAHAVLSRAAYRKFGISLVFGEMWDTARLALKPAAGPTDPHENTGADHRLWGTLSNIAICDTFIAIGDTT
jgi:hypothetical protein